MAAPTRQQLRRNELGEFLVKARATLEKYSLPIAIGLGGVVVLIVVMRLWSWSHAQTTDAAWGQLADVAIEPGADNSEAIAALRAIDASGNAQLALAVQHRLGCALLQQASFDASQADALVSEAMSVLKPVASEARAPAGLSASANFALATAHEFRGEFDAAEAIYKSIAGDARLDGSPFRKLAEARLADVGGLRTPIVLLPGSPPPPPPASAPATTQGVESAPSTAASTDTDTP